MNAVLYIHGMGGSAAEAEHYGTLFPKRFVSGLDYKTFTPWETGKEIREAAEKLKKDCGDIILIANSIGAFFSLYAGLDGLVSKAFFISPVTDMERMIHGMMTLANVCEDELRDKGVIKTPSGAELSWEYLRYVRENPVKWDIPTHILYGERDALVGYETVAAFAERHGASLTVMKNGEHWFHTYEQMRFLDGWINGIIKG